MSAVDSSNLRDFLRIKEDDDSHRRSLSGLTLDAVLSNKRPEPPSRTLLDIIRDEDPRGGSYKGIKENRTWKSFRDRLRLKRAGSAWTSSLSIPTSDIPIQNNNRPLQFSRRSSVRYETVSGASNELTQEMTQPDDTPAENTEAPAPSARPQISRRSSTRMVSFAPTQSDDSPENSPAAESPARNFRPQISRHNSTRFGSTTSDPTLFETSVAEDESEPPRGSSRRLSAALAEERAMSAREVVADQEAEEAAAEEEEEEEEEEAETPEAVAEAAQPVRMSLMDLLEETDRQMGFVGSRYTMADEDFDEEEDEEEEEEEEEAGSVEYNCCVCMVRHKGAAFIPCGHTFCRLCSRELWVQRGNCPLCNGFILEILDIF